MSSIYKAILAKRQDMTEWMIHFTHDQGPTPARQVLKTILIEGVLRPGFAPRGVPPKATVYGPDPAVCFTEQPLGSFLQYLAVRGRSSAMDGYGLLIHKDDVYAAGGLPVIYGLTAARELKFADEGFDPEHRILGEEALPLREQYRYVAFAPTNTPSPIDWSHEREWRWSSRETRMEGETRGTLSLGLTFAGSRGAFRSRVNAFVARDEDLDWLRREVSRAYHAGQVGFPADPEAEDHFGWWHRWLPRVHVISLETASRELARADGRYNRFEDWPDDAKYPLVLPTP